MHYIFTLLVITNNQGGSGESKPSNSHTFHSLLLALFQLSSVAYFLRISPISQPFRTLTSLLSFPTSHTPLLFSQPSAPCLLPQIKWMSWVGVQKQFLFNRKRNSYSAHVTRCTVTKFENENPFCYTVTVNDFALYIV